MPFRLPEKITVWVPVGNDGLGGITWSAPLIVSSRQALKQEKFTDINGDQQISKAVCYSESEQMIARGARILFGESSAVNPPPEADDVRAHAAIPSGTNLKKAWL